MILQRTVVLHQAALGDFVLTWSALRHWRPCMIVTGSEKGRIACDLIEGLDATPIETHFWNALWHDDDDDDIIAALPRYPNVQRVVSYLAPAGSRWHLNARRVFPSAIFDFPSSGIETMFASPPARSVPPDRVIVHVGAGGQAKRWPVDRSCSLVHALRDRRMSVTLLAGEVEADQFTRDEREAFKRAGGSWCTTLRALVDHMLDAPGIYVGFDTGPTHLAGYLGLPTIAIFGPTDPMVWRPRGDAVFVVTPADGSREVSSVSVDDVLRQVDAIRVEAR